MSKDTVQKKEEKKTKKSTKPTKMWFQKKLAKQTKAPKEVAYELTFNLRRTLRGTRLHSRAARAMREIKKYVRKTMGTSDVRLDPGLNKAVWSNGIRSVPPKVRLFIQRRKHEDEEKQGKFYSVVNNIVVGEFSKLKTKRVEVESQ